MKNEFYCLLIAKVEINMHIPSMIICIWGLKQYKLRIKGDASFHMHVLRLWGSGSKPNNMSSPGIEPATLQFPSGRFKPLDHAES